MKRKLDKKEEEEENKKRREEQEVEEVPDQPEPDEEKVNKKRRAPANVWAELTDTDPAILRSKFQDSAIAVVEELEP